MFNCVRCGRPREDHDTNLVLESDETLQKLGAQIVLPGYELSLLTCCSTPRPTAYTELMHKEGCFFGYGAGYVSPNPVEEDRLWREEQPISKGDSVILLLPDGRTVDIGS